MVCKNTSVLQQVDYGRRQACEHYSNPLPQPLFQRRRTALNNQKRLGEDANTFVLKEYPTVDAQKYYENEAAAFDKVGHNNDNLIKYYGSFVRGNIFNLLLDHADKGTLRRVFEKEDPPTSSEDIIQFWEEIFKLTHSLACIHAVEPFAPGGPQIFQG